MNHLSIGLDPQTLHNGITYACIWKMPLHTKGHFEVSGEGYNLQGANVDGTLTFPRI